MADINPLSWWRRLLALPNTSPVKTMVVVLMVALTSAIIVSATAVSLRPLQQANLAAERTARMQQMVAALPGLEDLLLEAGADSLEAYLVDLSTGTIVPGGDAVAFDQRVAEADPEARVTIPDGADIAGIGYRLAHAPVYLLRRGNDIALVVLPVYGTGYQSTLRAYLALEGDLDTVAALTFYEQGDTPGLGSRIQDPAWEALWPGTRLTDDSGELRVAVARGRATTPYEVDGLTGATRTTNGVTNLIRFWLGEHGFGPFLERLAQGEIVP
jgi:Na+-transporting NADH:ubiquinone oxidoreductase subunit C